MGGVGWWLGGGEWGVGANLVVMFLINDVTFNNQIYTHLIMTLFAEMH